MLTVPHQKDEYSFRNVGEVLADLSTGMKFRLVGKGSVQHCSCNLANDAIFASLLCEGRLFYGVLVGHDGAVLSTREVKLVASHSRPRRLLHIQAWWEFENYDEIEEIIPYSVDRLVGSYHSQDTYRSGHWYIDVVYEPMTIVLHERNGFNVWKQEEGHVLFVGAHPGSRFEQYGDAALVSGAPEWWLTKHRKKNWVHDHDHAVDLMVWSDLRKFLLRD